jgi:hypothetical protein
MSIAFSMKIAPPDFLLSALVSVNDTIRHAFGSYFIIHIFLHIFTLQHYLFFVVLGIEQRASHLSYSASLFIWVIFDIGSCLMPGPSWTIIFLFVLPCIAGMTGTCHHAQSLVKIGGLTNFLSWLALSCDSRNLYLPSS